MVAFTEFQISRSNRGFSFLGDWVVTDFEEVYDTEITLIGNLVVEDTLVLNHVRLNFNCSSPGQFGIIVTYPGFLRLENGSEVNAIYYTIPYYFIIYPEGKLSITDSEIHHCGFQSPYRESWGLMIWNARTSVIRNSTLSNNYVGLVVLGESPFGTSPVIEGNLIANNTLDGVWTGYNFALTQLHHNWIIDNGGNGVCSWGNTELIGNVIAGNHIGLSIQNSPLNDVKNNTIIHNGICGILINSSYVPIDGNVIAYNNGSGIIGDGLFVDIHNNNIFGNGLWGVFDPDAYFNASLNWWGSSLGPGITAHPDDMDPEEINGTMDYEPWLTEPYYCGVPPQIMISYPHQNEIISGSTTVSTQVASLFTIERVDFFLDDIWMATDSEPPYEWTFNSFFIPDGPHTLSAVVINLIGVQGENKLAVMIDNQLIRGNMVLLSIGGIGMAVGIFVLIIIIKRRWNMPSNGNK